MFISIENQTLEINVSHSSTDVGCTCVKDTNFLIYLYHTQGEAIFFWEKIILSLDTVGSHGDLEPPCLGLDFNPELAT